ncbi:MAG TPA: MASE1 domain-containing protein [Candidatus Udaeobacter sp.]|nr:MASE1 domain-containing protein [Candidatus Udaeobacter sp.]
MKGDSAFFRPADIGLSTPNEQGLRTVFNRHLLVIGLWVFAGYYLGCKIGFALTFKPHPVSILWPPNSILVAALLLTPPRVWWFILVAAFPAHLAAQLQSHVPLQMILSWFISNSCEAVLGAGLMRYLVGRPIRFTTLRTVSFFCLCVVFLAPLLSSFLDSAFVVWNQWGQDGYWELVRTRLSSNALSALIIVPLIVTWGTDNVQRLRTVSLSRYLEAGSVFVGLLAVSYAVLYEFGSEVDVAVLFLPLPFLLWAAVRFGALGASTGISVVGFLAIWSASHGHGPFSGGTPEQDALSIQIFLIGLGIPLLCLGAVVEERVTGETELRESESRFQIVADAAPVLIWMSGADKLCTFFNKPWLEFTGRRMEQELGNGWAAGVHPDDLQQCLQVYTNAFEARQPFVIRYRLRRNDGEYRWLSDQGVPRYDAHGNFTGYIGSCVDVSDVLNKDEALRRSEERMRLAADAVHLGIWEWDLTRNEIWATNARRGLLGWPTSGKVTFEDFISRVHPEDRSDLRQTINEAIRDAKDYDSEYRLVLPDGIVRWMSTRGSLHFDGQGKPARILGISIDITARKQAELDAQRDRAELSHLSRVALMGEMSASVAHELNQPLAGILSNAAAGQRFIDQGDVDLREIRELLGDIMSDGRRASEVVRGIRGMVKKEQIARRSVDLNQVVRDAVRMASADALLHSSQLETSLAANLPPVDGDPVQLQQVLLNLVINSLDAMRDTPVANRTVAIATRENGDGTLGISVRDYGLGISEEMRERLFDPFFSTKTEGLGMGLAIVRSIIESHGGTITAENANGGGARFEFVLPINDQPAT